jgi:FHS family L-fucose permease-like MFS transporter
MDRGINKQTERASLVRTNGNNYLIPFLLVTSLFFLWGFAHSLLDVLNKHFQDILGISKAESGLVQFALYGGYMIMAIPAGLFMNRFGYKKGIILGLLLYAIGAFFFYPASLAQTFFSFLFALFIIACGLTFLETAANPYTTVLGPKNSAAQRINLSQSFNGLGWVLGPLVGGLIIFGGDGQGNQFSSLAIPYVAIGFVVLVVAVLFYFTPLPEIKEEVLDEGISIAVKKHLYQYRHFKFAVVAQFLYVAAQTGINSFFINYVTETIQGISNQKAALILSFGGMGLFFIGRLSGSFILKFVKPNKLIAIYAGIAIFLMAVVVAGLGWVSVAALIAVFFFESIMFPTIFALGIRDLGSHTKKASSYIVLGVAGGAIFPIIMGWIADVTGSMAIGFLIPLLCFVVVLLFGLFGYKVKHN